MTDNEGASGKSPKGIGSRLKVLFRKPLVQAIGGIGTGLALVVGGILGEFGKDIYSSLIAILKDDQKAPHWDYPMSLEAGHCHMGNLSVMFRDYQPTVNWRGGADRLVICASAHIKGVKEKFPLLLEEEFPECLSVSESSGRFTIATNLGSPAVCRAPYRYDGASIVETSLPGGVFVCMPGHKKEEAQDNYRQDGVEVPVCKEEALKERNFL
ncbi:hypothetical protein KG088_17810 [Halomonas sp. TRM85114]|uniref:hypothetical protein n=1 Tax=Halomonas jincaotanensis TaxID=2810616 RepID=UPI001BD5DE95|nr:hypothetical protein [Halomonas jincaotanensis]MBS9405463.1 hypothetical protein [Halomonas jincaotanensis]